MHDKSKEEDCAFILVCVRNVMKTLSVVVALVSIMLLSLDGYAETGGKGALPASPSGDHGFEKSPR